MFINVCNRSLIQFKPSINRFINVHSNFDKQKSGLHLKIDALNDLEKYIIEDRDPQFLPPNVYLVDNDAFLITSVNELYSAQIKLNQSLSINKEVNPNIIEIRQSLKQLKQNQKKAVAKLLTTEQKAKLADLHQKKTSEKPKTGQ